jgi:hypothetical protein
MNARDIFFTKMERIIPLLDGNQEKTEFVKAFFKKELGIDEIENSMISLKRMNSKVFYYLFLSLLIDFSNNMEIQDKIIEDSLDSRDSTYGSEGVN